MKQLTLKQQQRFSSAIKHGFITKDVPTDTHTFVWTWIKASKQSYNACSFT